MTTHGERGMPISVRPGSIAQRLLPVLGWLLGYRRNWVLPDLLAGLAVWAVMVPESMAYAGIVGVPPIMGLYTIVPSGRLSAMRRQRINGRRRAALGRRDPAISRHTRRVLPYAAGALTSFNSAAAVDNMEAVVD
jgi:sulfate permease family protein